MKRSDLRANQVIREAIQKIALHGLVDPSTNTVKNTGRITGYVAKIHTDESDELYGTVDVQEYSSIAMETADSDVKIGYHEGVYLSSLQDNSKGMVIIPKLYSEVTIVTDPETQTEYVSMFSHVDIIQLDSHDSISIGVKEREEFDESDEESPDVDELEETGVYTNTTYSKNSIVTTVQDESDSDNVTVTLDGKKSETKVSDKSTLTIDQDKLEMKRDKGNVVVNDDESTVESGKSKVKVTDGTVYLGSESGTDDAVLGGELADILSDIVGAIAQILTPTMMGPQPPATMMGQFISMKAKIASFKAAHSGFLTNKVLVQK